MSELPGKNSGGENMDTSRSPDQSKCRAPLQAAEQQRCSVMCPDCKNEILYSNKKSADPRRVIVVLSKNDNRNQSSTSSSGSTHSHQTLQAPVDQRRSLMCPYCNAEVSLSITTNGQHEIYINLLVKEEKKKKKKNEEQNSASSVTEDSASGNIWPRFYSSVKVYRVDTGETFRAADAIMRKVLNNSWSYPQVKETNLEDCDIIIVFCPILYRVGSDVDTAMNHPTVSQTKKPLVLVLMHHTRDPNYSTEGTKWSEVHENVRLDVHVFFHETVPGLLSCKHNDQAIKCLQQTLYKIK